MASIVTLAELIHVRGDRSKPRENAPDDLARVLVDGNAVERQRAAGQLPATHHDPRLLIVVAAQTQCHQPEEALRTAFATQAQDRRVVVLSHVRGQAGYALISLGSCHADRTPTAVASEVRAALCTSPGGGTSSFVGVSAPGRGWGSAPDLHRQAEETLKVCQRRGCRVLAWAELGADPLLLQLLDAEVPGRWPGEDIVDRLVSGRGTTLLDTAEAFLDCAGDVRMAAVRLHVHRSTLYYRLRRVEDATALDLGSGPDRLVLQIAVRLHRLRQESQVE